MSNGNQIRSYLNSEKRLIEASWRLAGRGLLADFSPPEQALIESICPETTVPESELCAAIRRGEDPLGEAFLRLRPSEVRRSDGATYTPDDLIATMLAWLADNARPTRIVDPGAGSARFLLASGRVFEDSELVAVDIDPLACLMARANLTAAGMDRRARVVFGDFRSMSLPDLDGQTAFVGNPPYVRHHQIEAEWKHWLTATAALRGLSASQLAGLHVHFFLATLTHARPGDLGAFITSAEWLDVNYGSLVRQLLLDGLGGESVHVIDPRSMPFEGTATTGAITCFRVGSDLPSLRMRRVEKVDDLGRLDSGRRFSKKRLREARRWTPLLRATPKLPDGYVELGELCRVHRGAVTGANNTWVTDPDDAPIPRSFLYPAVTRARELFAAGETLTSDRGLRAVIDLPPDLDLIAPDERRLVERFLRSARRAGVHTGYIAKNRRAWWSVGLRDPAPILATYMARRPPAFVRNPVGVRHINIAHGLYPREPIADATLDSLARYLRESVSMAQGRTYAGGLTKFEPREMERIPVPDLPSLTEQ
jgi:adenine-specific DNA-methyltransferase